jgi:hypothetical protein
MQEKTIRTKKMGRMPPPPGRFPPLQKSQSYIPNHKKILGSSRHPTTPPALRGPDLLCALPMILFVIGYTLNIPEKIKETGKNLRAPPSKKVEIALQKTRNQLSQKFWDKPRTTIRL